jgi:adenosylcobinamide kinase/adenosylcobinamide-phosphate guanylyltransferase
MTSGSVLVTGGVRSGKSTHAESLLSGATAVVYVAPGPAPDVDSDPDWATRVALHRDRRPVHWSTVEGHDLSRAFGGPGAVLVDCLGTWVSAVIDAAAPEYAAWEWSQDALHAEVVGRLDEALSAAQRHAGPVVWVTNEVGWGVIPEHRSGRLFRDLLGTVNQRVAGSCAEVHLVVSGRVLVL